MLPSWMKIDNFAVCFIVSECRRSHLQLESVAMVISIGNYFVSELNALPKMSSDSGIYSASLPSWNLSFSPMLWLWKLAAAILDL